MSRIRSIHPGQWTDEDFVSCSMSARLLAIGLRNEADDNGIFEWKPVGLKMRLFPADQVDVAELLDELLEKAQIRRFEYDGRSYGAIRNFRVYQNPRSPKSEHPTTSEIEVYVGTGGTETEEKRGPGRPRKQQKAETKSDQPKSFPQNAEKNSLMERRGEEKEYSPSDSSISEQIDGEPDPLQVDHAPNLPAPDNVGIAFDAYQNLRRQFVPGARAIKLDRDRRAKLAARLVEVGPDGWSGALANIRGSPFLRGETSRRGFVAEIDWLLEPRNLRKVIEGNYDDRRSNSASGSARSGPAVDAVRSARAAVGLG